MGIPIVIPNGIDFHIGGNVIIAGSFALPDGSITDSKIQAGANLSAVNLEHQYEPVIELSNHATSVVAQRVPAFKAKSVGSVIGFSVDCSVPPAAAGSCTIDLKKNGASILTAPITLNDTAVANTSVAGVISSAPLVAGDRLDVEVAGVTGTTAKGVAAYPIVRARAQ